jgi:predicted phosphodiesterase
MRVALISDIHANAVALHAVLDDIERVGADRIVCLGDVATLGPRPHEVLETLRRLSCPCIMGNHDAFLLDPELIRSYTEAPIVVDSVDWCRGQLTADEEAFLGTFVPRIEVPLSPGVVLLLFHGSPRSHMEDILATTPADELDRMLEGHAAAVHAGGHTHVQMLRQHRGVLVVNPGSVGLPFREFAFRQAPTLLHHAEYAVIEAREHAVGVTLLRVALDREDLRREAESSECPNRDVLVAQYS